MSISIRNLFRFNLNSSLVDKISSNMVDFLATIVVFHFKGFWPSLIDLYAWISHVWELIISGTT